MTFLEILKNPRVEKNIELQSRKTLVQNSGAFQEFDDPIQLLVEMVLTNINGLKMTSEGLHSKMSTQIKYLEKQERHRVWSE